MNREVNDAFLRVGIDLCGDSREPKAHVMELVQEHALRLTHSINVERLIRLDCGLLPNQIDEGATGLLEPFPLDAANRRLLAFLDDADDTHNLGPALFRVALSYGDDVPALDGRIKEAVVRIPGLDAPSVLAQ